MPMAMPMVPSSADIVIDRYIRIRQDRDRFLSIASGIESSVKPAPRVPRPVASFSVYFSLSPYAILVN